MRPSTVLDWGTALSAVATSGALRPIGPAAAMSIVRGYRAYGPSLGLLIATSAARYPDRIALIDESGAVTYRELLSRSETIAASLHSLAPGLRTVGVLCRNHRGFVEAVIAGSRLGCELVFLNTELPAAQLARILERHAPDVLIHDDEYLAAVAEAGYPGLQVRGWVDSPIESDIPTLDQLARHHHLSPPPAGQPAQITLLTSGTSGMAKGVARRIGLRPALEAAASLAAASRLSHRDIAIVAPPFFHGFGLGALAGQLALGATAITRRRFDPELALADIERHKATVFIGVPIMIQRLAALPAEVRRRYDLGSLRLALTGAAPISPNTIETFLRDYGPRLINGYGSTEAGVVSIATPADLEHSPKTVGRPILGVSVRILRADRTPAAVGETGTIFVRGGLGFNGYTADRGGSAPTKEIRDGYVNVGDMGHLDAQGRLYIDGRDDEMIVSGGENIYPREVENALAEHPAVSDVIVVGIPDPEYGQVLRAYLVTSDDPGDEALRVHIRARLERYKVPKQFVRLPELPRNPSGKVLRHKLGEQAAS
ncbi:AMP-binding protein [Nocardia concava]|uniref:AMP-binding protein n=1 Tax=Nocardia concava TaxID=257281 RepID=UPI0002F044B1|nr:AMP-binding protein [Nocardia concava]